ncbi:hypothetical protein [Sphingobium sp.]|uniref:hypothetical protein n=1 Tax=Sphingobium sp. TaxID=1912891 RepID=UPI003BB615E2
MSKVKMSPDALDFLVKAYLLSPDTFMNQSSIAVFGNDYQEHNAAPIAKIVGLLERTGCIKIYETRKWQEDHGEGDVVIFRVSPLGRRKSEEYLQERIGKSLRERISSTPRSDWIALAALVVSIIALFVSGS